MNAWIILAAAAVLQAPQVELQTLSGPSHAGELRQLGADVVTLETSTGPIDVPIDDALELRFRDHKSTRPPRKSIQVTLADGSHFSCSTFTTTSKQAKPEVVGIGKVTFRARSLARVRFAPAEGAIAKAWEEIISRQFKSDTLIVRKGEVLDFLSGVIGDVDEQTVKFLLDGEELSLPRKKVFGLIFIRRGQPKSKSKCGILLSGNGLLHARSVELAENMFSARLSTGGEIKIPIESVQALDFSQGKVVYLSAMEQQDVKYVPYFDITWKYRRDSNLDGGPLRLGGKIYSRGLAIHSRTTLRYRLRGNYRRFQAVMGIDQSLNGSGHVHVIIHADDKLLLETDVSGGDDPRVLDLNVTDARDLRILVDFGEDLDISDHLDLADARVIK